jgi:hypothetical protein
MNEYILWQFVISDEVLILKDNENWQYVFRHSAGRGFLAPGPNGKNIIGPREQESWIIPV